MKRLLAAIGLGATLLVAGVLVWLEVPLGAAPDGAGGRSLVIGVTGVDEEARITAVRRLLDDLKLEAMGIADVRRTLERVDWIDAVAVRRGWPNRIEIEVRRRIAVARWGDAGYLDENGMVFVDPYLVTGELPLLRGPSGSEKLIMWQYQQLSQVLARTGGNIEVLAQDERGAWTFSLAGIEVKLGKEDVLQRMRRFMRVYRSLADEQGRILSIDTRYPNGVAVAWREDGCVNDCLARRE